MAEVCASKALVLGWGMAAGCPGGVSSKEKACEQPRGEASGATPVVRRGRVMGAH